MPYALVTIGLLMIITGINNTYAQFGSQLQSDFAGSNGSKGFLAWVIALFAVGALGYIRDLREFSHYFMALILISMVLANKGFFQNLSAALSQGPKTPQADTNNANSADTGPIPGNDTLGGRLYVSPNNSSSSASSPGNALDEFLLNAGR